LVLLGLVGADLGICFPANHAEVMAVIPARDAAAAGGMVNMSRGIGTALGVVWSTLTGALSVRGGSGGQWPGGSR